LDQLFSDLGSENVQLLASLARIFFPFIGLTISILDQLFSDLGSENVQLLASLASVLKNVSTLLPLCTVMVRVWIDIIVGITLV
jgi:hypothetical protein